MKCTFIIMFLVFSLNSWSTRVSIPVQEFERTYLNLASIDLSECKKNYRFINGNWMDCTFKLPAPKGSIQITPAHYPILDYTLNVELGDVTLYIDVRTTARSFEEASTETTMWISSYYRKEGVPNIHMMNKEFYSSEVLAKALKRAFAKMDANKSMTATIMGVPDRTKENTLTSDKSLQDIFVGVKNVTPELNQCKSVYLNELQDRWPDPDVWSSGCTYVFGEEERTLPLGPDYWSEELVTINEAQNFAIKAQSSDQPDVYFYVGPNIFSITVGDDMNVPFPEAKAWIDDAIKQAGTIKTIYLLKKSEINTQDTIMGRMVLRKGKIHAEKISKL
jgi:hypothetical protein